MESKRYQKTETLLSYLPKLEHLMPEREKKNLQNQSTTSSSQMTYCKCRRNFLFISWPKITASSIPSYRRSVKDVGWAGSEGRCLLVWRLRPQDISACDDGVPGPRRVQPRSHGSVCIWPEAQHAVFSSPCNGAAVSFSMMADEWKWNLC